MWLRALLVILVLLLLAIGGLHARASRVIDAAIVDLRPHALLRYDRLLAWPGGRIDLVGVSLEPVGSWRAALGVPLGYRIEIDRLQLQGLEGRADDRPVRARLRGLKIGVRGDGAWAEILRRVGESQLHGEATLRWQGPAATQLFELQLALDLPEQLHLALEISLAPGPGFPAWSAEGTRLERARLDLTDGGLLARLRQADAQQRQLTLPLWEQRIIGELETRTEAWGWRAEDQAALYEALRRPQRLRLQLDPPSPVALDSLGLYAPEDRWSLFGAQLDSPP